MADIAVIILTYNESLHLQRALESVKPIASSLHVIDSGSTDDTLDIARQFGAETLVHPFKNQADQYQWAEDNITTSAKWLLRLDADEIIEADLAAEIAARLSTLPADVKGVTFDRKHIFLGRWIRHGGRYPLRLLRLYRRGHGRIEQRWMDEHIVVDGRVVHFRGGFADHNLKDLTFFVAKHNGYATREALDVILKGLDTHSAPEDVDARLTWQAKIKRALKQGVYNKLPFPISVTSYFLYRYFIQLGFLDGIEGLCYHFLQGYWYRFLVGAKTLELRRQLVTCRTPEEIVARLEELTGHRLTAAPTSTTPSPASSP